MQIRGEGLMDDDGGPAEGNSEERVVYVLHPNCAVEDLGSSAAGVERSSSVAR
jgi:DNA replication licensing factor MCM6